MHRLGGAFSGNKLDLDLVLVQERCGWGCGTIGFFFGHDVAAMADCIAKR